ncbi:HRDC domain-containing protein [Paenibacillus gorillae]|uniref:HRDC domain-containing protein n=1 Tax=Paenibacillus gorillae TaxID=1243662 RepID=UPI0004AE0A92|nr:HRDC domain-containing protein [Paenibacillus gorillae]
MHIVFLNTFERPVEGGRIASAKLSICEREGVWSVLWVEGEEQPAVLFEGTSWEEMIVAFRHGVAVRMGEGFTPVIDGMLEEKRGGAGSLLSMLQCYGELHANAELFEALRDWRRTRAGQDRKSAYLIATNRMLWMISAYVPQTPEELLQIPGWGESKHNAYGEEVLEVTGKAPRTTGFPLQWVADELDPAAFTQWLYKQKENKYKNDMVRQHQKKKILHFVMEGGSLEQLQTELELPRREVMDRIEQLETEGYDFEPLIDRELSDMPDDERELIWNAFQQSGDRYLKPVLQQVYGAEGVKDRQADVLYERLRLVRLRYRKNSKREIS